MSFTTLRQKYFSRPALKAWQRVAPGISDTEQAALEAGTVGFEAELFAGRPDWRRLQEQPAPRLSDAEQAFLDGPVAEACRMCDDWEVTHERADLSPELWRYLAREGFFGMVIPTDYNGLGFSAWAHSRVLQKLAGRSATLASNVSVPNSLGPAELLLHYGTDEQKDHYLPRLARGEEIPCFALTGPQAGSDATAVPDTGVVCKGQWQGEEVLGVKLNFDKRYITLAPIATLIGVAFQLQDPDGLLDEGAPGITLALVPHDAPGLEVGRRHLPLNIPFQNGPVRGTDVFVPLDQIIGGPRRAGHGWRMLVECLSVGRAISLPSNAAGGAGAAALLTGAYARVREQFGTAIGNFEGVAEALARIAGRTYSLDALTRASAACVDRGEKPAVVSALTKYHTTEYARQIASDAMDVHGGKGIILGPRNYLGRGWQGAPISITVEGANIMTRSLMVFGQGALRCHPHLLAEMEAANLDDPDERLQAFDQALSAHVGYIVRALGRAPWQGLTGGRFTRAPAGKLKRHYQRLSRYSAALCLASEVALLSLGGALKRRESLSARLGDVLSQLHLGASLLKRFEDEGCPEDEKALLEWSLATCYWRIEQALLGVCRNFPNRVTGVVLRGLLFPVGAHRKPPSDALGQAAARAVMTPGGWRDRLAACLHTDADGDNALHLLNEALEAAIAAEPLKRRLKKAHHKGDIDAPTAEAGREAGVISETDAETLARAGRLADAVVAVDDFAPEALRAGSGNRARHAREVA